jgi:hypothetical protein
MNSNFTIERIDGISIIRLKKDMSLAEMLDLVDQVAAAGVTDRRLWDATGYLKFSSEELGKIAARGRQHWPTPARVAYLAADDVSFGLFRMFEVFREQENYETRVFREEQEAMNWLKEWAG